jgi:hypothetical protein
MKMEEQEESEVQSTPWYDRGIAKGANLIFAIIGVIATAVATGFGIYVFLKEPTSRLVATYQEGQFILPNKLTSTSKLDSLLAKRDTLIGQLYKRMRLRLTPRERLLLPDSLRPYGLARAYSGVGPVDQFAQQHQYFYSLNISNEGERTFTQLHVIHGYHAYYEYKDSNGTIQQGESAGNLLIGDLAATETREVHFWAFSNTFSSNKGIVVTYGDGKVQAKPVTVDGSEIVKPKPTNLFWSEIILYLTLAYSAFFAIRTLIHSFTKRT